MSWKCQSSSSRQLCSDEQVTVSCDSLFIVDVEACTDQASSPLLQIPLWVPTMPQWSGILSTWRSIGTFIPAFDVSGLFRPHRLLLHRWVQLVVNRSWLRRPCFLCIGTAKRHGRHCELSKLSVVSANRFSDCHGLCDPHGSRVGYSPGRVRVAFMWPSADPYPQQTRSKPACRKMLLLAWVILFYFMFYSY